MFSFNEKDSNYRQLEHNQIIIVFISSGGFLNNASIMHNIKPIAVQYNAVLNQFISIENSIQIIPFITNYTYPGWNIFERVNTNYRNKLIEGIKNYGQTFTR